MGPHTLSKGYSNNEVECKALIIGLELALELPIEHLIIYGDSILVVRHINGFYHIKNLRLMPYFKRAKKLAQLLWAIQIKYAGCGYNTQEDALTSLDTSLTHPKDDFFTIHIGKRQVIPILFEDEDRV